MGILGKDLFDFSRPRTNTKIEFGSACYWVEHESEQIPYGSVLTEILNLDCTPFQETLDTLNQVVKAKNYSAAPRAFMDLLKCFESLPLYRIYLVDYYFLGNLRVEEFVVGEARDAFAELVIDGETKLPQFVQQCVDDIQFIQRRYAWFLDSMFEGKEFEKKKGQRKEPLAEQITAHALEAFVSGTSLGEDSKVDAPQVKTQYAIRLKGNHGPEMVEKMYFDRLIDFVYVEFMKSLQKGFVPKRCANCGRWFLQTPGATFSYCNEPAPGMDGKTCREIGAATNFREKVRNNVIWQIYLRAYKKYFARTKKTSNNSMPKSKKANDKSMSKTVFERWATMAEKLRDEALMKYENAKTEEEKTRIAEEFKKAINCY